MGDRLAYMKHISAVASFSFASSSPRCTGREAVRFLRDATGNLNWSGKLGAVFFVASAGAWRVRSPCSSAGFASAPLTLVAAMARRPFLNR